MTTEKARVRRAKVNTAGHGKSTSASIPKKQELAKSAHERKPKAWNVQNALEIVGDVIKDVESAGQANDGLPSIHVSSIGAMAEGQAPRVMIVLVGAYYCTTCNTLSYAATMQEAKCVRCAGGEK